MMLLLPLVGMLVELEEEIVTTTAMGFLRVDWMMRGADDDCCPFATPSLSLQLFALD